jgi:hypothetical protein
MDPVGHRRRQDCVDCQTDWLDCWIASDTNQHSLCWLGSAAIYSTWPEVFFCSGLWGNNWRYETWSAISLTCVTVMGKYGGSFCLLISRVWFLYLNVPPFLQFPILRIALLTRKAALTKERELIRLTVLLLYSENRTKCYVIRKCVKKIRNGFLNLQMTTFCYLTDWNFGI